MDSKLNSKNSRFAKLAAMSETIFHAGDLANIWAIRNKNTLYQTLSRYKKQGLIYRLHKGLYSLKKLSELDPYEVGVKALHAPAYVSCESVLFAAGVINQTPGEITLLSGVSRRYAIGGLRFRSRKIHDRFLMNSAGIEIKNGVRYATSERAAADMLYFNSKKHFDSGLDRIKVKAMAEAVGYKIIINPS